MAFHVFGMRPISVLSDVEVENYGVKEMHTLISHYGNDISKGDIVSPKLIDSDQLLNEWTLAKQTVIHQQYPRDQTNRLLKLLHMFHSDSFPNLLTLANIALIMPYQTADCERGFSAQNHIKSAKRGRIQSKQLNALMRIKIEGGNLQDFNYAKATKVWKDMKRRRIDSGH